MAKGSPLMGTQRGRLGESILYRRNGEQVARAYIAHPSNPQSGSQMFQRMLVATVNAAYSGMKEICDHSFENVATGMRSMAYFLGNNIRAYRSSVTPIGGDISFNDDYSYVLKGVNTIATAPWIVARGSLPAVPWWNFRDADLGNWEVEGIKSFGNYVVVPVEPMDGGHPWNEDKLANSLTTFGYLPNDYLTFVGVIRTKQVVGDMDEQRFVFARFAVVSDPTNSNKLSLVLTKTSLGPGFSQSFDNNVFNQQQILVRMYDNAPVGVFFNMQQLIGYNKDCVLVLGGWIHSRPLKDGRFLRSNCDLQRNTFIGLDVDKSFVYENNSGYDVYPSWLGDSETIGETLFLLNGGSR